MQYSELEERFRQEVRDFFRSDYPQAVIAKGLRGERLEKDDHIASQQAIHARGWLGVSWPAEDGGTGWTAVERYIFDQELDLAGAAPIIPMGVLYIGPIICAFGSAEQKRRWLPAILESRDFWAQGYSEPEAGSDLASLGFSAVQDGNEYVLNGTKIWTSGAQWANWIFCLARTSRGSRKQDGLSLICARLDSPGITIHPIRLIDGSYELNRVEFENVRVPVANRIGDEGRAWHYANVLLKAERLSYAHIGAKRRDLAAVRKLAKTVPAGGGRSMAMQPSFQSSVARVEARVSAIETAVLQALKSEITMETAGALKIACTESAQAVTELFMLLAGRWRAPMLDRHGPHWADVAPQVPSFGPLGVQRYLFERAQTIYGGSTEIQKNIIWRTLRAGDDSAARNGLDEDQSIFQHSLREWFSKNYPFAARQVADCGSARGSAWDFLIRQMGIVSVEGIGPVAEMIAMEEAGRALLAEPLHEAMVAAKLLRGVRGHRAEALLAALAGGEPLVLAWSEPGMRDDFADIRLTALRESGHWRLDGAKALVTAATWCKQWIVAARSKSGLCLFSVPSDAPGLVVSPYRTIDGRPAADLRFDGVIVPPDALLGPEGGALPFLEVARDHAVALHAAEAAGVLAALVRQCVDYTSQRRQFGQPLADFQALQHTMVDMFVEAELVRAAAVGASMSLASVPEERAHRCSSAHVVVAKACRTVAQQAIQLHGGMGMADEIPLGSYARRAMMIECAWGDDDWHLGRVANQSTLHLA